MNAKRIALTLLVLMVVSINASAATTVIVQIAKNADINSIAASLGGTILDSISGDSTYLLSIPSMPGTLPPGVLSMTVDTPLVLPRFRGAGLSVAANAGALPWYANQPAFQLINAPSARGKSTGRGVIVADVDARVDVSHPALRGHLTTGYDFIGNTDLKTRTGATLEQSTASFLDQSTASFLDQSTASFLDQSTASFLDQSTASFLDQSTASFLDQSTASFLEAGTAGHGHATMVAGIIAALAPDALIMPLRAFDDNGIGDAFQVAKAIRYAVRNGAQVINLSLGLTSDAAEVRSAINFAIANNVAVVAAGGNNNSSQPHYPAALPNVIGAAATDLHDLKASFSDFGQSVFVAAPGVEIITAYPGGYAVGSGTSFSSAIVAAEVALIRSLTTNGIYDAVATSAVNIDVVNPAYAGQLGYGRIDLLAAVSSMPQRTSAIPQGRASRNFDRYIVRFSPGSGKADRAVAAGQAGASVRFNYDIVESIAIEAPPQALQGLARNPNVIEIVPDQAVFASQAAVDSTGSFAGGSSGSGGGTGQVTPSGITRVGTPNTGSDGFGVGVAIMDSGIDFVNTDLAPASQTFSAFGGTCQDDNGHGTAVAGLVAALNNTTGIVGVAPKSTLYCVKVLDSAAVGSDSNIIAGLDWINKNWNLVTPNIRVVNMSLGRAGTISDNSSYRTAIQALYNKGIVVVTAAGNDATVTVTQRVPMAYPEVLNVASTTALKGTTACKSQAAIVADSASYFTTDGKFDLISKIGITISAPGEDSENINSACGVTSVGMLTTNRGSGTVRASGTSVSAPLVSGVVARLMQKGNSGVENIRSILRSTASQLGTAPIDSRLSGYTFDGEREGIAKAP